MVAPEDDYPARSERRLDRVLAFFARPMQSASELLQDHRLSLALRTAAAFLFGTAFLWPEISDAATIRLFAAYTFVDGILALSPGGWGTAFRLGWPLLVGGVIDLAGSGIAYVWPDMTLPVLGDVAAVWAIASSFGVSGHVYDAAPVRQRSVVSVVRDRLDDPRQGAAVARAVRRDCAVDLVRHLRDDDVGAAAQADAEAIFDDVAVAAEPRAQHCISSMLTPSGAAT